MYRACQENTKENKSHREAEAAGVETGLVLSFISR